MRNRGFTILEYVIVIVVIGLLLAVVSAGKSLIQQANLRQVTTELSKWTEAQNSFLLQYNALPGDISNAYDYWGASCDVDPVKCNGNDDRRIMWADDYGGSTTSPDDRESWRYWQHLSLAGMIDGQYTGVSATNNGNGLTEESVPFSDSGLGRWQMNYITPTSLKAQLRKL